MIELVDGPCEGTYTVRRAPMYLRAVVSRLNGKRDVLDQLDDEPARYEEVFVYRRDPGTWTQVFVRPGGRYETGVYRLLEPQPADPRRARKRSVARLGERTGGDPSLSLTTDPNDPRLGHGVDEEPLPGQHEVYLVLSDEERGKGFVRPYVDRYIHARALGGCGVVTTMGVALSETYARDPGFYGATYCVHCRMHKAVGTDGEFYWCDTSGEPLERDGAPWKVGT